MAGNTFYLKIIAANRVFYAGRCRSLIVPEYDGQKEILAHHEDMVIAIDEGEMRFQPEATANWEYAVVGMGFVEIVNNRVTLLVETAEHPEEIDVARAREAKRTCRGADAAEAEHPGILSFQSILIPCPDPTEGNQQVPVSNRKVVVCCDSVINEDII